MAEDMNKLANATNCIMLNNISPGVSLNSAFDVSRIHELTGRVRQMTRLDAEAKAKQLKLQTASAIANIESRDQLIEHNELLRKQLSEQTEINQRLEYEFKMGAREAVITRKISYWSLFFGIVGVVMAIIALIRG